MDNAQWYILALIIGAVIALLVAVPLLKRKGLLNDKSIGWTKDAVKGAEGIAHMLKSVFPNNSAISVADKILSYASVGVANAEQLYRTDVIASDERKSEAIKFVRESLLLSGINPDEELMAVADSCIEAAVHALGHTSKATEEEKANE